MFRDINEFKPDRIQLRPPTAGALPWLERAPTLSQTYDFDHFVEGALFAIYVDTLAKESDDVILKQTLIGRSLSITIKPASADYLPHAVYELAARIDATIEGLRSGRRNGDGSRDHDDFEYEDLLYEDYEDPGYQDFDDEDFDDELDD